jgi:hypothetical protein
MYSVGFTRYDLEPEEEATAMRLMPMEYETFRMNVARQSKPKWLSQ